MIKKPGVRFVPHVLRVDTALGKRVKKALTGAKPLATITALLGKNVEPERLPAWLAFNAGGVLDHVVHLEGPIFSAIGADEDEFFSEPGKAQLVFAKKDRATAVTKNGDTSDVKITTKDIARLTAYDAGGFLLRDISWVDKAPATFADFAKLLGKAVDAYTGDLTAYEVRDEGPAPAAPPPAAAGSGGTYLGGPARNGFVPTKVAKKKPAIVWTSSYEENGGCERGGDPVIADGLIFAADGGFNAKCSATDLRGKSVWKTELSKNQSWIIGSACIDRGTLYQPTNHGLHALDAKTGKLKWTAKLSAVSGSPLVVGDVVFLGTGDGLMGVSVVNGRKQWKFAVKRDKYKQGVLGGVAFKDGVFFFVAEDKLFAVELASAKKLWTAPAYARGTPSVDDQSVYTWSPAGLVALDRQSGKERWHQKFEDLNWDGTIAVAADRVVVRADGKLVAVAKTTGKRLWEFSGASPYGIGRASPVIAGDVVLSVLAKEHGDPSFHAVDLASGKALWQHDHFPLREKEQAPLSYYCTPCVHDDGTIFVQAYGIQALR